MNRMSVFVFKQKTAYEMRISDWSSDVCSSDLKAPSSVALALIVEERDRVSNSPRKKSSTRWLVLEPSANGLKKPSTAGLKAVAGLFVPNTSDRSSVAGRLVFRKTFSSRAYWA